MKRVIQNQTKTNHTHQIQQITKIIGKAPHPSVPIEQTSPYYRFDTSLQLQLLNAELDRKNKRSSKKTKILKQTVEEIEKQEQENMNKINRLPFEVSMVKLCESSYIIQAEQQIQRQTKDKINCNCFSRFQQIKNKIKQQMKLLLIDYKIFKQQVQLEIKSYWNQVEDLIKYYPFQIYGQVQTLDQRILQVKIQEKKNFKDKLEFVQMESNSRKQIITRAQSYLHRLKQQVSLLEHYFLQIKISNLAHKNQISQRINSLKTTQRKIISLQTSHKHQYTESGFIDERQSTVSQSQAGKSQQQDKIHQAEIEIIKKKINGLKLRLNKTCSNIN